MTDSLTHDDAARLIDTDSEPGHLRLDPAVALLSLTPDEAVVLGKVLIDSAAVVSDPRCA